MFSYTVQVIFKWSTTTIQDFGGGTSWVCFFLSYDINEKSCVNVCAQHPDNLSRPRPTKRGSKTLKID